jgi:hypothetical protein
LGHTTPIGEFCGFAQPRWLDDGFDTGFSDGEVAEIIAHVALNVFTNYFNIATDVDIDFPKVSYSEVA